MSVESAQAATGKKWGDPISPERLAELQGYLDRWQAETDHGDRKGPFDGVRLIGADVSWLAEQSGRNSDGGVPDLHLAGANLEGANLNGAQLAGAKLGVAHLAGADLSFAHLERTCLNGAHLERADLSGAHLEGTDLRAAHLEGADLSFAHLEGADLSRAWLDSKTVLSDAILDTSTRLGDIQWGGVGAVNLTRLHWDAIPTLGDERGVGLRSPVADHDAAVRAYRQLAAQLRAQGMSEVADRFAERAQIRQRKRIFRQLFADWRHPWRIPVDLGRWLFSWFLALLAGYGYHPGRSLVAYLLVITGFALAYFRVTHDLALGFLPPSQLGKTFDLVQAFVLSFSAFHGRGFFNPPGDLGDTVAILATAEAVCGLFIEISFIATFTQRFFGSR